MRSKKIWFLGTLGLLIGGFAGLAVAAEIPNVSCAANPAGCMTSGTGGSQGTQSITMTWNGTGTPPNPTTTYGSSTGISNTSGMSANGPRTQGNPTVPTAWTATGTSPTVYTLVVTGGWKVPSGVTVRSHSEFKYCISITYGKKSSGNRKVKTICWDIAPC